MKKMFVRILMTVALLAGTVSAYAQTTVKGTVKDATGEGIIGASVMVQGTHNGTIVNPDGTYTLANAKVGDKLEFSCIGYSSQVITWNGGNVDVVLEEDAEMLEGTVVTALGIRKDEKKLGYAVSTVNSESLMATASPTLGTALYGKAAGVRVTTAPGGATGAISINVRGLSTITGTNQPLVIVDGVPVRNGDVNNDGYWGQQRMETNGLADINVEDIESLSILKGASATSLYGSEGANGVVLITMKKGKRNSGTHVEFGATAYADMVAYMPRMQTVFGPGDAFQYWYYYDVDSDPTSPTFGFTTSYKDRNGQTVRSFEGMAVDGGGYYGYGPEFDGKDIYTPSGVMKYSAITDNPYKDIFRTGFTQQYNVSVTSGGENGNTRFSYTWMDNTPNQYNSHLDKHNFQISGSQNITKTVQLGYSVNYMKQAVKNRPYRISRLVTNFAGMVGSFDDAKYFREHTVTSAGYQNRVYTSSSHENPSEGWEYSPNVNSLITEYYWNILGREQYEDNQRLIASVTPSWQIIPGLTLKGNIATDWTGQDIELKEHQPTAQVYSGEDGYYGVTKRKYQTVYGDALLNWQKDITDKIALDLNVGYSARNEKTLITSVGTNGGLTVENWFNLNASKNKANASMSTSELLKQAVYATAGLSFGNYLFLEATIRNEKTSTLAPGHNSYFYPSFNASLIYSELLSNRPSWYDYGKLRASYGVVGLAPAIYKAAVAYNQSSASGYTYNQLGASLGNEGIRPETTHEWEFGIENKFMNNRYGFELTYYHKRIIDQILESTVARSAGGSSILMNVGELTNQGVELAAYATLIENRDWRFEVSGNAAWNANKVVKLADGVSRIEHSRWDNGAAYLYSYEGEKMGDIYAFDYKRDANGNKIIRSDGYYARTDEVVKVGNAMPDLVGGFAFNLGYKRVTLDMNFSYQIGGDVFNMPYQYYMHTGQIEESLPYRNESLGGQSYYLTNGIKGDVVPFSGSIGPDGQPVRHDGVVLDGVLEDGSKNTMMVSQEMVLERQYGWGTGGSRFYSGSIFKNTYLKCREITLSYAIPESFTRKFHCSNFKLSAFARNPFFIYKNLPIFDAEATDGTNWAQQVCIGGSTSTSRTFGISLRANF